MSKSAVYSHSKQASNESSKSIKRPSAAKLPQVERQNPALIIQRVQMHQESLTRDDIIQLQNTIGNRAVAKFLSGLNSDNKSPKENKQIQMKKAVAAEQSGENKTGIPNNLKSGLEALSNVDLSDARVYKNSDKPASLGALAYTQGSNIYVGPGQEKHLPHEGWHVVQQKQGRVKHTIQMKIGVSANDDEVLEREADLMGRKAGEGNNIVRNAKKTSTPVIQPKRNRGNIIQMYKAKEESSGASDQKTYVVKSGDTLETIAKKFNTTVDKLAIRNNIKYKNKIYPKQELIIPILSNITPSYGKPTKPYLSEKQKSNTKRISNDDVESVKIAIRTFYYYFSPPKGSNPTVPANTSVTPEVAIEILKNLSNGRHAFRPELGKGGCSWFLTEGNPHVGIDVEKNIDIPVEVSKPKGTLVFNEAKLYQIFEDEKNAIESEAMAKFRKYNGLTEDAPLNNKMRNGFKYFHKRFAESRMWDRVGELVKKSSSKVGEVVLQEGSAFSRQGSGKFAVVADASKIQVKGGVLALAKIVRSKGVAAEPVVVEAAEAMATKLKWAGTVKAVFRYGGRVLIVVGVAADIYKVYVAKDKVKAVVESVGGWAGATAGAAAFASFFAPADVAGPWAWLAHGVGTLAAGGIGYWIGSETTRMIYELAVE